MQPMYITYAIVNLVGFDYVQKNINFSRELVIQCIILIAAIYGFAVDIHALRFGLLKELNIIISKVVTNNVKTKLIKIMCVKPTVKVGKINKKNNSESANCQ